MFNWGKMQTVQEVITKITPLLGTVYTLPITSNKGKVGNFLEDLAAQLNENPALLDSFLCGKKKISKKLVESLKTFLHCV